jgi:hypothetical protein
MRSLYEGLTGMGIATNRIFYESFGPATVLKREAPAPTQAAPVEAAPAPVRFVRSDIGSEWSRAAIQLPLGDLRYVRDANPWRRGRLPGRASRAARGW